MITKQLFTNSIYLAGTYEELESLNFSLYNFCNNFNSEIQSLGGLYYFITNRRDYIHGRSRNIHFNWKYENHDGTAAQKYRRTRMARKLSILKAKKELDSYQEVKLVTNSQSFQSISYKFGAIPRDLDKINNVSYESEIVPEQIILTEVQESEESEEKD